MYGVWHRAGAKFALRRPAAAQVGVCIKHPRDSWTRAAATNIEFAAVGTTMRIPFFITDTDATLCGVAPRAKLARGLNAHLDTDPDVIHVLSILHCDG
jgi:hypothetical protein